MSAFQFSYFYKLFPVFFAFNTKYLPATKFILHAIFRTSSMMLRNLHIVIEDFFLKKWSLVPQAMMLRNLHIVIEDFFLKMWSLVPQAEAALDNIKKEWFSNRLTRFCRGSADGHLMSNNGLESTNRVSKGSGTLMKRTASVPLPLNTLFVLSNPLLFTTWPSADPR